jgi:ribonuclease R
LIPAADAIVEYLRTEAGRPLKAKELARALGVETADYAEFKALLRRLEDDGALYRVQRQRYAAPARINLIVGRLQTTRSGAGFVVPDEGGGDLYVPAELLATAVDGDRVVARLERRRRGDRREGSVVRVLERARSTVVGVYHTGRNFGYVVPEDQRLPHDVYVAADAALGAADGDVVVVRILEWGGEHRGPAGVVERIIGRLGEPGVDVLAVAYGHELPLDFPPAVEAEAEALRARGIVDADLADRDDLRAELVFTIDPVDAKDHDDALSIRRLDDGAWHVGVHIADVSNYVTEGGVLDAEALARGTSVYLVDRVIPMLPHALSADLCSLVPDRDRLALSLLLELDATGAVRQRRLARSVIRSRHKLSYEQAQAVLERETSIDVETDEAIRQLAALARRLRANRAERGSIDFDLPEARVVLSAQGEPTDIQRVRRLESHRLVEDFMLLANETIAAWAARARLPFLYRVHEPPDTAKLEQLAELAASLGYRLRTPSTPTPGVFQELLDAARGRPEESLLSNVVLRSMKQARYHERNLGHFGLAARHYTHFTSPIRRYPDLIVHRICAESLVRAAPPPATLEEALPPIARRSSERERVAVAAERDSIDLKKVEFMQRHVTDAFDGTIASVRSFGFFVLLDVFFVEGLVHVSSLTDDYYVYVEEQYALIGERTRRQFRVGDRVRVCVAGVDIEERRINFELLEGPDVRSDDPVDKRTERRGRGTGRPARAKAKSKGTGEGRNAGGEKAGAKRSGKSGKSSGRGTGKGGKSSGTGKGGKSGATGKGGKSGSRAAGKGGKSAGGAIGKGGESSGRGKKASPGKDGGKAGGGKRSGGKAGRGKRDRDR